MEAIVKDFGLFIKYLRWGQGWKQGDLADRLKVPPQNIGRIENGRINPTLVYIERLAKAFDLTVSDFMEEFEIFREE